MNLVKPFVYVSSIDNIEAIGFKSTCKLFLGRVTVSIARYPQLAQTSLLSNLVYLWIKKWAFYPAKIKNISLFSFL